VFEHLPASVRAYAVTQRGHGDAPRPDGGYDVEQLARDVVAFIDDAGIERAVVAGHSMGSVVATRLALDAPARVAALVLMGARPRSGATFGRSWARSRAVSPGTGPRRGGVPAAERPTVAQWPGGPGGIVPTPVWPCWSVGDGPGWLGGPCCPCWPVVGWSG